MQPGAAAARAAELPEPAAPPAPEAPAPELQGGAVGMRRGAPAPLPRAEPVAVAAGAAGAAASTIEPSRAASDVHAGRLGTLPAPASGDAGRDVVGVVVVAVLPAAAKLV